MLETKKFASYINMLNYRVYVKTVQLYKLVYNYSTKRENVFVHIHNMVAESNVCKYKISSLYIILQRFQVINDA